MAPGVVPEPTGQAAAVSVSLPATTTAQQDITHAGQRRVNLIWETTQSVISVAVTLAVIYCAVEKISSPELTNSWFLIIGFYYSRTNHSASGGVGPRPVRQDYVIEAR